MYIIVVEYLELCLFYFKEYLNFVRVTVKLFGLILLRFVFKFYDKSTVAFMICFMFSFSFAFTTYFVYFSLHSWFYCEKN